ncbi:hypothetical protein O0544_22240 [Edwardsiella anguillarum]|nr:hypothetical protein [Edwardsiella anguillarum]
MSKPLAVVAVGGNALIQDERRNSIPDQYAAVMESVRHITDMVDAGWDLVITHGNGPRLASSCAVPSWPATRSPLSRWIMRSATPGRHRLHVPKALHNELARRGIAKPVVTW